MTIAQLEKVVREQEEVLRSLYVRLAALRGEEWSMRREGPGQEEEEGHLP
jgi:hypothetical protein